MTTIEMEIAIMEHIGVRRNLIVPNASWGAARGLHECDLLVLTGSDYAWEVEIKITKQDLIKDSEKAHQHKHNHIANLYFAVPYKLRELALSVIPERAGLYTVRKRVKTHAWQSDYVVVLERKAKRNALAVRWSESERMNLSRLGAMRILGLKKKLVK